VRHLSLSCLRLRSPARALLNICLLLRASRRRCGIGVSPAACTPRALAATPRTSAAAAAAAAATPGAAPTPPSALSRFLADVM
jgi:hypothetical protein